MALEVRSMDSEMDHYLEQSQTHRGGWPSAPISTRYAPASPMTVNGGLGAAAATVPGALSRKLYPTCEQTTATAIGGDQHRKPWLKPVSSLLRGIPQSKLDHPQGHTGGGGSITSRYPSAPSVHVVPTAVDRAPTFPVWHEVSGPPSATSVPLRQSDASMTSSRGAFCRQGRPAMIEAPRATYTPIGRNHHAGSVSPRTVRAQDVFLLGISNEVAPGANDHHRLYDLPSPAKRHHPGIPRAHGPIDSAACHGMGTEFRSTNEIGPRERSFGSFGGGVRTNDGFNYYSGHQQQQQQQKQQKHLHQQQQQQQQQKHLSKSVVAVPREAESYRYGPAAPADAVAPVPAFGGSSGYGGGSGGVEDSLPKQRKEHCLLEGCVKRPTHAKRGEKPSFCLEHRTRGMMDVVRRNRCLKPDCSNPPRYALPGQKAEYCSQHKMQNYVDVKHPRCESEQGCVRQPTFGWEGEKARFCSAHKVEGMLDVKNPRCAEPGCMKRPRYGDQGERARFCAAHKYDDMVDLATRRGPKCSSPTKRSRDGPRSFAHDSEAAPSGARRSTMMPSFSLGAAGSSSSAPAPKRGHTPAHAGGHRRATSESWIDFCPKRLYETTAKTVHEDTAVAAARRSLSDKAEAGMMAVDRNMGETGHGGGSAGSAGSGGGGGCENAFQQIAGRRGGSGGSGHKGRMGSFSSVNITPLGNELVALSPAPVSPSPMTSPSASSARPLASRIYSSPCARVKPPSKTHRFDALDYEASAILLECRSGALLPPRDS